MEIDSSESEDILEPTLCIDTNAVQNYVLSDTPSNGHEYLYRVMNEAKKCPQTVVASIKRDRFVNTQNVYFSAVSLPKVKNDFLPSDEWKLKQIENFNRVRDTISRIKPNLLSQSVKVDETFGSTDWWNYIYSEEGRVIKLPLVSAVCSLEQVNIITLLELHVTWLEKGQLEFRVDVASWIFSLLACLEIPLDPDTCDSIRSLAKYSWNRRSTINSNIGEEGVLLQSLNLLICLIGTFFGQADLAD